VRSDPDLGPFPFVGRQVEDGIVQREVRRVAGDQLAAGVPQGADGGQGFFQPCHRLGPLHAVGFVAFSLARSDSQDCPSAGEQMQRCGCLSGDRGVASTGVGDADSHCYLEERAKKECLTCGVTVTVMSTTGS
jgi:hypothetical protein